MLDDAMAHDLAKRGALTAATIDLTADLLALVDTSSTHNKFKPITPAELSKALKRDQAQALRIPLLSGRNSDGSVIAAAAAAGKFGISLTPGTSHYLVGETASSNTKTDIVVFEAALPANYVDGDAVTLVVNALETGVATVKTLAANVYKAAPDGTHSADLNTTSAQALTTAAAEYSFVVTPTALAAGDRLLIALTLVVTEAAAGNVNGKINSVRLTF